MRLFTAALSAVALIAAAAANLAWADNYPSKPIRLIVPAGAGSPPDIRARWLAEKLRPVLGQPIVVDNRPGAAGMIGTQAAARSAPDGYTLVMVHQGTLALNPHLYAHLPYDPVKDLAPVSRLVVSAMLLAVHPAVPAHSVADLVRLAKENPGQLNFGSGGTGSPPHMAGELFRHLADIDVWHIPYKSTPDALTDLIGGSDHLHDRCHRYSVTPGARGQNQSSGGHQLTPSCRVARHSDDRRVGIARLRILELDGGLRPRGHA